MQSARDWYREVTSDVGMHADLVEYWIRIATLLILPIAPHFSEHIWTTMLKEPETVQKARWPTPKTTPDKAILDAGQYMRDVTKDLRDAELGLLKKMNKGKQGQTLPYDPKKPRSVRIYVATSFPQWQDACVQIVKDAYVAEADKVDDVRVRELLTEKGLIKDKRMMPFIQAFKVRLFYLCSQPSDTILLQKRMALHGAETAFNRTVPFSEVEVLHEIVPYITKSLNLVSAQVFLVEDARAQGFSAAIFEGAEPGSPAFEYYNA